MEGLDKVKWSLFQLVFMFLILEESRHELKAIEVLLKVNHFVIRANCWLSPQLHTDRPVPGWTLHALSLKTTKPMQPLVISWKRETAFSWRKPSKVEQPLHPTENTALSSHYNPLQSSKSITKTYVSDCVSVCACTPPCKCVCVPDYIHRCSNTHNCFPLGATNEKFMKENRWSVLQQHTEWVMLYLP